MVVVIYGSGFLLLWGSVVASQLTPILALTKQHYRTKIFFPSFVCNSLAASEDPK